MSCTGTTKKGAPCKARPLTGKPTCLAHADQETREKTGFGGSQPGAGRPRNPKAVEVLREWLDEHWEEVLAPLRAGLTADRAVVVGNGPGARVEIVPDAPTRIAASKTIIDYGFGKPKQAVELSGPDGDAIPVEVDIPDTDEYRQKVAELASKVFGGDS